jgi:uncharacterized membrane protein YdjX (TVP38/TMEM64 family)
LATDVLLPIPSSVISNRSGWQLGVWRGTLATWIGMNLGAVVLSNLGIKIAYSAFGDYAQQHQWLPLALGVSVAIPLLVAATAKRFFPHIDDDG